MKGTVKWFNNRKGYGFITDENGEDVFFHYSGITGDGFKTVKNETEVTFDLSENEKGACAVNIALA